LLVFGLFVRQWSPLLRFSFCCSKCALI
jgi:hypothetical protein